MIYMGLQGLITKRPRLRRIHLAVSALRAQKKSAVAYLLLGCYSAVRYKQVPEIQADAEDCVLRTHSFFAELAESSSASTADRLTRADTGSAWPGLLFVQAATGAPIIYSAASPMRHWFVRWARLSIRFRISDPATESASHSSVHIWHGASRGKRAS